MCIRDRGYGEDHYCLEAAAVIRKLCGREDAAVHFLVGGTQANTTVIASALRPYQAAVGALTAHINVHETGAVEATGHKVLALPSEDGKISSKQVEKLWLSHINDDSFEHMAQPKLVYISNPTELGTIYTCLLYTSPGTGSKIHRKLPSRCTARTVPPFWAGCWRGLGKEIGGLGIQRR